MPTPSLITALTPAFSGRSVFLTGDTGFKGSWLALLLHRLGARVTGFALPPESERSLFVQAGVASRITHRDGDIRDADALRNALLEAAPEHVFHLAAQPLVRRSYADPKTTFDTNVGGSTNLLEAVRACPETRTLVFVTSDKCYKNKEWIWGYRENDELGGRDPYSASKSAAEILFASYGDSFFRERPGFGFASVRAGNVIGGGDWAEDRIVPDCIGALRRNEPIIVRSPTSTRPWQHVLDPVSAYLILAGRLAVEPQRFSGAWNIGPRSESVRTVRDLAEAIVANWGSGRIESPPIGSAPHEAGLLHLNCDKAHHLLGWQPRWDFGRAVAQTTAWYRETASGADAGVLTDRQIDEYLHSEP